MQARDTATFDHVKRDLRIEEDDGSAQKGAALVAMSEDQKRVLARLNTPAAAAVSPPGASLDGWSYSAPQMPCVLDELVYKCLVYLM